MDTRRCGASPRPDAGEDVLATCANTPCFPPNRCVAPSCEGPTVYQGCCPCPEGTVEASTCPPRDAMPDGELED